MFSGPRIPWRHISILARFSPVPGPLRLAEEKEGTDLDFNNVGIVFS